MSSVSRTKSPQWVAKEGVSAADLNAEFNGIINGLNGSNDITTDNFVASGVTTVAQAVSLGHTMTATNTCTFTGAVNILGNITYPAFLPAGTIVSFYDFNAAVTFDTNVWSYCNGQNVSIGGSTYTTPDLSNRYLVGFGTEGGADLDAATWETDAVGSATNQINVAHSHTCSAHVHEGSNHRHQVGDFYYYDSTTDYAGFIFYKGTIGNANNFRVAATTTPVGASGTAFKSCGASWDAGLSHGENIISGYDNGTNNTTSNGAGVTSTTGSSTLAIQPRSIRVRYIIKVV